MTQEHKSTVPFTWWNQCFGWRSCCRTHCERRLEHSDMFVWCSSTSLSCVSHLPFPQSTPSISHFNKNLHFSSTYRSHNLRHNLLEKTFSYCWTSARIHILKTLVAIRDGSCLSHVFLGTRQVWGRRVSLTVIFHQGLVMEKCLDFNSYSFNYSIYNLSTYCAFPVTVTCDQGTRDIILLCKDLNFGVEAWPPSKVPFMCGPVLLPQWSAPNQFHSFSSYVFWSLNFKEKGSQCGCAIIHVSSSWFVTYGYN